MVRILIFFALASSARSQTLEAIVWRYGHAEHISTRDDQVTEWPAKPCGHPGHAQRGLGPRPTDEQLEALRLEYRASPEYAATIAAEQERERERVDMPSHEESIRALEDIAEALVEDGVLRPERVPGVVLKRINRRRALRGLEPLQ